MKLDLSGLQSFTSIPGGAVDGLGEDIFAAPSFQLPACSDVCFLLFRELCSRLFVIGIDLLFLFSWLQFDGFQKDAIQMVKPAKGTTTLAFIFKEGVIVAADSRASMGGYICKHLVCWLLLRFAFFLTVLLAMYRVMLS